MSDARLPLVTRANRSLWSGAGQHRGPAKRVEAHTPRAPGLPGARSQSVAARRPNASTRARPSRPGPPGSHPPRCRTGATVASQAARMPERRRRPPDRARRSRTPRARASRTRRAGQRGPCRSGPGDRGGRPPRPAPRQLVGLRPVGQIEQRLAGPRSRRVEQRRQRAVPPGAESPRAGPPRRAAESRRCARQRQPDRRRESRPARCPRPPAPSTARTNQPSRTIQAQAEQERSRRPAPSAAQPARSRDCGAAAPAARRRLTGGGAVTRRTPPRRRRGSRPCGARPRASPADR